MTDEKRRFSRIPFDVRAVMVADGRQHTAEKIDNLSVGGCLLPMDLRLPPQTRCRLLIALGDDTGGPAIDVEGIIIRSGSEGIAIQFTGIDPEGLYHLQNIIRHNYPNTYQVEQEFSEHPGLR